MSSVDQPYLSPYLRAAERHGAGFGSLLWASPRTQRTRFEAIRRMFSPAAKNLLDAGCGRADYLAYLLDIGIKPASYIGIEGVKALADAAEAKRLPNAKIIRADFVRHPARLFVGADIVIFSGSLNTLRHDEFYQTLTDAWAAAGTALIFNFLCSSNLAGREYLFWRPIQDVLRFAQDLSDNVAMNDDYLDGDCTACLLKPVDDYNSEAVHA